MTNAFTNKKRVPVCAPESKKTKSRGLSFLLTMAFCAISFSTIQAQISTDARPVSITKNSKISLKASTKKIIAAPDILTIRAEDVQDDMSGIAPRFGAAIDVNFNLKNSGTWTTLKNGDRIWQLEIESPGASSINLNYDKFDIPRGAKFFVIDPNSDSFLGAFTIANVHKSSTFATGLLRTDKVRLEYIVPAGIKPTGQISVNQVVHGYRNPNALLRGFNESQGCSNNVNCSQYGPYADVKNSVAMLLTDNNTRFCTGALVNNTAQNCIPYLLTAKHCMPNDSPGTAVNYIFMFNYESPTCADLDGITTNTVQGAIVRAAHEESDFALLELNDNPGVYYDDIYYAGWSRENISPMTSALIHHPYGDVKKISMEWDPLHSTGYFGSQQSVMEKYWRVVQWNDGSSVPGSSGGPLVNENSRIVGQLHGGQTECSGAVNTDWFGKFWYSWDKISPHPSKQLKAWLDPIDSGTYGIDGAPSDCQIISSCSDGLINGDETGVDCGGTSCSPCITCVDGIMNGNETGVDCGGSSCSPCEFCPSGFQNILVEGFDSCELPAGWSTSHSDNSANVVVDCDQQGIFSFDCVGGLNYNPSSIEISSAGPSPGFQGCVATLNDDNQGFNGADGTACIVLPALDLSAYTEVKMRLNFQNETTNSGVGNTHIEVFNGFFYQSIMSVSNDDSGTYSRNLDQFISSNFKMKICYSDAGGSAWGAAFDNLLICGSLPGTVPEDCPPNVDLQSGYAAPYGDVLNGETELIQTSGNTTSSVYIANGSSVNYTAEGKIALLPGFTVSSSAVFSAVIQECQ